MGSACRYGLPVMWFKGSLFGMDGEGTYLAVINEQEQYSLWSSARQIPLGWRSIDVIGSSEYCLGWIQTHWLDQRPKCMRLQNTQAHPSITGEL
ncbi:MbtH family NRPS accessory protein [Pseudomonas mosselii]|uniref:MbtH family NRPS accessory protein n=1 Tax=Pseudomonas mosselii TaxID=78327 RepID=UPI0027E2B430|nr:MbtH family NRPS accessory protein [Pseudomonas mosselii]